MGKFGRCHLAISRYGKGKLRLLLAADVSQLWGKRTSGGIKELPRALGALQQTHPLQTLPEDKGKWHICREQGEGEVVCSTVPPPCHACLAAGCCLLLGTGAWFGLQG